MKCKLCNSDSAIKEKYHIDGFKVLNCKNCGLVFLDIMINGKKLEDLYCKDYYKERKEYYFDNIIANPQIGKRNKNIDDFDEGLKMLRDLFPQRGKILDVGCGIGIFLEMARRDNWHVTGVDISPFASRYAKEVFGINAYQGSLNKLKFLSESFTAVTMWDIVEHFTDPLIEIKEISRILKKGGVLLLNTPNEESLPRVFADLLYKMSFGRFRYPVKKLYHIYHLYYFNPYTLTKIVESMGLKILTFKKRNIPIVKARGFRFEKAIVKILSSIERPLGREYELFLIAQKN